MEQSRLELDRIPADAESLPWPESGGEHEPVAVSEPFAIARVPEDLRLLDRERLPVLCPGRAQGQLGSRGFESRLPDRTATADLRSM